MVGTEKRTGAGVHGEPDEALAAAHKHALPAARRPQEYPGHALSQDKLSLSAAPCSLPTIPCKQIKQDYLFSGKSCTF
jgi:hypothetical protein